MKLFHSGLSKSSRSISRRTAASTCCRRSWHPKAFTINRLSHYKDTFRIVMNIYLTNHADVRHTRFCTAHGQVMYKSETPGFLHTGKKTTIYKTIPNDEPEDMTDRFAELAAIEWRIIKSSTLTYDGAQMPVATEGIFAHHRIFTAPGDGRCFKWTLGFLRVTLELNDGSNTIVAQSHRSDVGLIGGGPRQAYLEIFPDFEHLVDVILATYILVEKIRKDREKMAERRRILR